MNNYYSQFGEDEILNRIFSNKESGFCIEIGANDGKTGSNSLFFEKKGWTTLLVEPNPSLCEIIKKTRSAFLYECGVADKNGRGTLYVAVGDDGAHGVSMIAERDIAEKKIASFGFNYYPVDVKIMRLDDILVDVNINKKIDFISIDVEGGELEVLKGFDLLRWSPTILIIEDNSNLEDRAVRCLMGKNGYVRFKRTVVNDWYVKKSEMKEIAKMTDFIKLFFNTLYIKMRKFVYKHRYTIFLKNLYDKTFNLHSNV